jgi:hypothetical protein
MHLHFLPPLNTYIPQQEEEEQQQQQERAAAAAQQEQAQEQELTTEILRAGTNAHAPDEYCAPVALVAAIAQHVAANADCVALANEESDGSSGRDGMSGSLAVEQYAHEVRVALVSVLFVPATRICHALFRCINLQ